MIARRLLILLAVLLACGPSAAQEADTSEVVPEDGVRSPLGFRSPLRGRALSDSLPAVRPDIDLVELLSTRPGSFTYLFDRSGWPDGWSPFGLSPNTRPLVFNGIPFNHVFTGRPAYNLVPFAFIERPRLEAARFGQPYGVLTRLLPFVSATPITEGTYWRGGDGLQSIDAMHAQHRRRSLFGTAGFLNVMGSYSGRATNVDYPGSDLRRGRRVQLRLRYEQPSWSLELLDLHNRRRIGAHHGVVPQGGDFNSIYRSDLAEVERPEAERRVVRNDLMATLQLRVAATGPSIATGFWTAETFRYRDASDTLTAASDRIGALVGQPLARSARHRVDAYVEAWSEHVAPRDHFAASAQRRSRLHAYVRDSLRTGSWHTTAEAGWVLGDDGNGPTAALTLALEAESFRWITSASTSRASLPALFETGFGTLVGQPDVVPGHITAARTEAGIEHGDVDVAVGLFAHYEADPVDVFADGDSAAVLKAVAPFRRVGAYLDAGWRRGAQRGFYATLTPTVLHMLDADRSMLHRRETDALPVLFGRARVGARYVLFQGDLDFDLYVEGIAWSSLSSRTLHPQTGLLVVPEASSLVLGASNMLNLVAEVRVRDAKLFLIYDNILSGTSLLPGNFLIPIYPLPAQRFRFGVYWPIFG